MAHCSAEENRIKIFKKFDADHASGNQGLSTNIKKVKEREAKGRSWFLNWRNAKPVLSIEESVVHILKTNKQNIDVICIIRRF
jgi:hypothetical protein